MSYLDNLESNLKALESRNEKDPKTLACDAAAREDARSVALEIAPYAEALRNGPFKDGLLATCRNIGIAGENSRAAGLGRLDAPSGGWREQTGVAAHAAGACSPVFHLEGREQESTLVDLSSDPVQLAEKWLQATIVFTA